MFWVLVEKYLDLKVGEIFLLFEIFNMGLFYLDYYGYFEFF